LEFSDLESKLDRHLSLSRSKQNVPYAFYRETGQDHHQSDDDERSNNQEGQNVEGDFACFRYLFSEVEIC
jgi:hypothetical protein